MRQPSASAGGETGSEPLTRWEGQPVAVWESLWEVPRLEAWSRLGSTNDRARALARAGALPSPSPRSAPRPGPV